MLSAPVGEFGLGVGFVVVADQIQLPDRDAAAELFAEVEELRPALTVAEPVEHLARRQIQSGEHLPDTGAAVVGGTLPSGLTAPEPAVTRSGLQVERPELVHAEHSAIGGWMVVEVQDAGHLGGEVRVAAGDAADQLAGGRTEFS